MRAGRERAVAVCVAAGDIERVKESASRRGIEIVETCVGPGRISRAAVLIRQGKATAVCFATLAGLGNSAEEAVGAFAEIGEAGGALVCLDPDFDTRSPLDRGIAVFAVALAGLGAARSSTVRIYRSDRRCAGDCPDRRNQREIDTLVIVAAPPVD